MVVLILSGVARVCAALNITLNLPSNFFDDQGGGKIFSWPGRGKGFFRNQRLGFLPSIVPPPPPPPEPLATPLLILF